MSRLIALGLSATVLFFANAALAGPQDDRLQRILPEIQATIMQQGVVTTLRTYNKSRRDLTQADIDGLESIWQADLNSGNQPLVTGVVRNMASLRMRKVIRDTGHIVTAINIIDTRGLSVAQTTVFPYISHGRKAQIASASMFGAAGPAIRKHEFDDSTRENLLEVQFAVADPDTDARIGTVILFIDMDSL